MNKFGITLLIAFSLGGCDLFDDDSSRRLDSENWVLTGYSNGDQEIIISKTTYELSFNEVENILSGTIDCNSFITNYSTTKNSHSRHIDLEIEYIAPTEMRCPYETNASEIELEQYNDQNTMVLFALSTTEFYVMEAATLKIFSFGGQILYYEPSNGG